MKKICFFVLFVTLLSSLLLCSCSGPLGKYEKYVSEYRVGVYEGSNDNFSAQAASGYRENPFVIDGVSNENKVDFLLVTVTPNVYDPSVAYTYTVSVNEAEYSGELNKHPFQNTYSFEVPTFAKSESLTVFINGEELTLTSVVDEDFILPEKAFEISLKRLEKTDVVKGGKYEIYVRLIENPVTASGGYFWYVAFVDENKQTVATLIQPQSMEIVAVRE